MKFTNKLNKIDGNIYTVEEELVVSNGKYEGVLAHDNINHATLVVYSGKGLTGDKIDNYVISKLEGQEWKTFIELYHDANVYAIYETEGDIVEAEDINLLQDEINKINSILENGVGGDYSEDIQLLKAKDIELEKSIDIKIANLVDSSPSTLDTLKEIAEALGNDPNFATTITNELSLKANTDYVNNELSKKSNVHSHPYKDINYVPSWNEVSNKPSEFIPSRHNHSYLELSDKPVIPIVDVTRSYVDAELTKKSDIHNHPYKLDSYIPSWNEITNKPTIPTVDVNKAYVDEKLALKSDVHSHPYKSSSYVPSWSEVTGKPSNATQSVNGFMSNIDKIKLDGIQNNANYFSGSYNDLSDKPSFLNPNIRENIPGNWRFSGHQMYLSSHLYRHRYCDSPYVYDHYYQEGDQLNLVTFGILRVSNGEGGYKEFIFGGNGTLTWDNKEIALKGNIPTKMSQLENDIGLGGIPNKFTWSMLRGY